MWISLSIGDQPVSLWEHQADNHLFCHAEARYRPTALVGLVGSDEPKLMLLASAPRGISAPPEIWPPTGRFLETPGH